MYPADKTSIRNSRGVTVHRNKSRLASFLGAKWKNKNFALIFKIKLYVQ